MDPNHTPPPYSHDPRTGGFSLPLPTNEPTHHGSHPPHPGHRQKDRNPAADLIRKKLMGIYASEPDPVTETIEAAQAGPKRSKHQQYMYELSTSGKSLADIQTAWHEYYAQLPNKEKHQVWQEFYAANAQPKPGTKAAVLPNFAFAAPAESQPQYHTSPAETFVRSYEAEMAIKQGPNLRAATKAKLPLRPKTTPTVADVKHHLVGTVHKRAKLKPKHHLQSLAFGLATGALVILVLLFGFFNERFIAPFITPSRNVSATPLIVDEKAEVPKDPKMIIPKINVELPVVYTVPTIADDQIEAGLEGGVVHYPTTPNPGEIGNAVFFGHSSSNILNNGKFKFAFVLLNRLEIGDTFFVHYEGKRYVYKVFDKKIVKPTQVDVLNPMAGHAATATLITCDPPGTSVNRLVVTADQISPDPGANTASTALQTDQKPTELASDAPTLWSRFVNWLF